MTDLSYLNPPIELVANSQRAASLSARLRSVGVRPIAVGEAWSADSRVPLLVDTGSVSPAGLARLQQAASGGAGRTVILLSPASGAGIDLHDCLLLQSDDDLASLPARLELRRRRDTRASEIMLRKKTAETLNARAEWTTTEQWAGQGDILYVGEGGQMFQALKHGVHRHGHDVIAALTIPTAESYLATGRFAVCCLQVGAGDSGVMGLLERLSLGQIMIDMPVVLIAEPARVLTDMTYLDVVDDVIAPSAGPDAIVRACLEARAKGLPTASPVRIRLGSDLFDAHTRLYSRAFLDAHLPAQMQVCSELEAPLCLLSLRVNPSQPAETRAAHMKTLANAVTLDLRSTDLSARSGPTDIIIALRETPYAGAVKLSRRLIRRVCDARSGSETPDFSWRIVECRASHTAETLIEAALSGSFMRANAA